MWSAFVHAIFLHLCSFSSSLAVLEINRIWSAFADVEITTSGNRQEHTHFLNLLSFAVAPCPSILTLDDCTYEQLQCTFANLAIASTTQRTLIHLLIYAKTDKKLMIRKKAWDLDSCPCAFNQVYAHWTLLFSLSCQCQVGSKFISNHLNILGESALFTTTITKLQL